MNTYEMRKQQDNIFRIKHKNRCIRYQAEHFARLEDDRHGLTTNQFKAVKCLLIKILRAVNH